MMQPSQSMVSVMASGSHRAVTKTPCGIVASHV
jgi:hypothetical protein